MSDPTFDEVLEYLRGDIEGRPALAERLEKRFRPQPVILELSEKEAKTLRFICGRIAGSPVDSPRKYTDSIERKLDKARVSWDYLDKAGEFPLYNDGLHRNGFRFESGGL